MRSESIRRGAVCALLVAFTAQFSLRLFSGDFMISVAVVLLPFFAMIWGRYPVVPAAAAAAVGNFALRTALLWLSTGVLDGGSLWQEMVFYLVYGLLFAAYCRRLGWRFQGWTSLLWLAPIDYLSNLAELLCRGQGFLSPRMHLGLLAVAVVRTALIASFWLVLQSQRLTLLREEHAERYRHLLLLISRLQGEVLWMRKTAAMLEDTMNTAYRLYTRLQADGVPACTQALSISKDVHEIKKEYQLVIRGLSEAMREELEEGAVSFRQLWQILYENLQITARHLNVRVEWTVDVATDFQTERQSELLSVLRNLLDNAIEAAEDGRVRIAFSARRQGDREVFTVTNWGRPIPPDCLPCIFDPGFSTKVNYDTGQVGRGIGLCLVKDLTEQDLGGEIRVEAGEDRTSFIVSIPTTSLEVSPCDSI